MTTIAYDGKSLVSDSRSCIGDMIYEEDAQKIFPDVGPFVALGIAGDYQAAMDTIEMISPFTTMDHIRSIPSKDIGNVSLLGVTLDGRLWSYAGDKSCELRSDKPFAVGSGSIWAMAAMDFGESAEDAVVFAATKDPYTNDIVQVATFVSPEEVTEEVTQH